MSTSAGPASPHGPSSAPVPGPLLERVLAHRDEILVLTGQHRARQPRLFGSVARHEDTPASDIDLLVDFLPGASLLDHAALQQELSDLLSVHVDVVSTRSLRGEFGDRVRREAIEL